MVTLILKVLFASNLFVGFYIPCYAVFDVCLSDDVEFCYGKKRMRNRRKQVRGWWKKFLFLDIKKEVIHWHYVMFWVNLISSIVAVIALDAYIIFNDKTINVVFLLSEGIALFTCAIISCVRWKLYVGNKVRNRKKYRK